MKNQNDSCHSVVSYLRGGYCHDMYHITSKLMKIRSISKHQNKKSFNELGWSPQIDFSEGLDDVIDWVNINWATIIKQPLVYIHKV